MDELVDSMDDLPQLMAKMQTNSQRDPTSVSSNLNKANMISDPSQQRSQASEQSDLTSIASKVKDSLSKLSADSPQSIKNDKQRPTYETSSKKLAEIAKKALENMKKVQKENNSQSIYRVYDTHQRGTITYNDFAEVMVHTAAGISKSTARQLARELDSNQSGLIDYRNITQKLSDLATIEIAPSYPPLPSESATVEAIQNNHRNSPEKTLRVPSKVSDKNMSSNSYHIPSESKEKYNDIVDVQSLSPTLQTVRTNNQSKTRSIEENRERIIKGEGVKKVLVHDDQNQFVDALDPLYTPRRHYTHHHKSKLPYALDYHVKGSIDIEPVLKGKKRPSSAPSRHSTVHQLFQMVEEVQSAKEIGSYPTLRDIYDHSVNASTKGSNNNNEDHIQQSPQPKPRRFSCTTRNNNIASIVSQIYPQGSPQIKASRESLHESLVPPALITASQVDGKINGLRHQLKKADKSKSGYVNFSEFQSAFNKLGLQVAKDDLKKLFHENSVVNHQAIGRDVGVGYSHGKGVKIEDFIDVIETNSSKSNESKGNSVRQSLESQKQVAKGAEQRRILRSVMLGLERSTDPLAIFHRYDKHHNGYIQPEHLRLGLQEMGISMSDREYKLFSQAVDVNHDGKIDVKEFKSLFDEKLNQHDREELHQKYQQLNQHPKYSNSYRSASDIINHTYSDKTTPSGGRDGGLNNSIGFSRRYSLSQERDSAGGGEYDTQHILNSKSLKMQSIRLSKLKQNLIENKEKVLKSFLTPLQSIQRRYGQQELDDLSYVELVQRFEKNGIHLGKDDRDQLQIQLNRYLSDQKHLERNYECHGSNQISVDTFCNAIGIGIDKIGEKTVLVDKREVPVDGGMFHDSAVRFQEQYPGKTSTILTTTADLISESGAISSKRKYKGPIYAHTYEPSKFWELQHAEKDILMPMPLMNYRDPSIISSRTKFKPVNPSTRRIARGVDVNAAKTSITFAIDDTNHRSSSAPPRTTSHDAVGHSNKSTKLDIVHRWGSQTLADYAARSSNISSRDAATTSREESLAGIGFPITQNPSLSSSNITAVFDHPNTKFGTAENAIGMKSRTLRRQYRLGESSEAPFALNY